MADDVGWNPQKEEYYRQESNYWWWSRLTGICATGLAAIATGAAVVAACYAGGAYQAAKEQLSISRTGSRPYVLPQVSGDMLHFRLIGDDRPTADYVAIVDYVNFGPTPAIVHEIEAKISIKLTEDSALASEHHTTDLILLAGKGIVLPRTYTSRPITAGEGGNGISRFLTPFLHGKIVYTDVSGTPHQTIFCYQQTKRSRGSDWQLQPAHGQNCENKSE